MDRAYVLIRALDTALRVFELTGTLAAGHVIREAAHTDHATYWKVGAIPNGPLERDYRFAANSKDAADTAIHLANREAGFGWQLEVMPLGWEPPVVPVEKRIGNILKALGYTHVVTMGGPVPLDDWAFGGESVDWGWEVIDRDGRPAAASSWHGPSILARIELGQEGAERSIWYLEANQ
jgi:hypothetical protein